MTIQAETATKRRFWRLPFELNESEVKRFSRARIRNFNSSVSRLEDDAILGVKTRVKSAKWLRHAARSRGIQFMHENGTPGEFVKAARAMLGELISAHQRTMRINVLNRF